MPQVDLMFFYEVPGAPGFSDCVNDAIDEVLAGLPEPIVGSRVSYYNDNVVVLEVSTDQVENVANLANDVPGNLDLILPCLGEENITFVLTGVYLSDFDYHSDLSPSNRDVSEFLSYSD